MSVRATTSEATERDDVGDAEGLQQPPLDPARKNSGRNTSRMMSVAKTTEARISTLACIDDLRAAASALVGGERGVLAQPPEDVLHVDDGVVDQRADGDGHAAQGHGVDRRPERLQDQHRRDERQRDGQSA